MLPRAGLLRCARNDEESSGAYFVAIYRSLDGLFPAFHWAVIARSEATKQSMVLLAVRWIASRSLSTGAHSRDPLARNDTETNSYQRLVKISPFGIQSFDQGQFLGTTSCLDLLFPNDRVGHGVVQFVPDQYLATIFS